MVIQGLQKLTLLDYPEHTACTVFTGGCNFRCPFCHNASLVLRPGETPPVDEELFFVFLRKRVGILDGVCVTGGEPLLQPDLPDFLRRVRALGFSVKLDTNGSFPEHLRELLDDGLVDYVAMDIKNSPKRYSWTVGVPLDVDAVRESVRLLMSGSVDYEFRTTVVAGHHDETAFAEIGEWIRGAKAYYLQNFVDSGDLIGESAGFDKEKMTSFLNVVRQYVPAAQLRGI